MAAIGEISGITQVEALNRGLRFWYRQALVNTGPLFLWRMGEATGTAAADEMGAHAGIIASTPTLGVTGLVAADPCTAITFSAWPKNVNAGANDNFMPSGAAPRTLGWVSTIPSLAANRGFCSYGTGAGHQCALRALTNGTVELHNGGATFSLSAAGAIVAGAIHDVFVTYDGSAWRVYVDGALSGSPVTQAVDTTLGGFMYFGGDVFGDGLVGTQQDAAAWSRALSAGEIAVLHRIRVGK